MLCSLFLSVMGTNVKSACGGRWFVLFRVSHEGVCESKLWTMTPVLGK